MKKAHVLLFFLAFTIISKAQTAYTVETIPDPKTTGGGYVSNPDGVIDASTVETINAVLARLEDSTTIQVAVAVVNSIGNEVPGDFRTKLFRYWGIGQKDNNNGLLILLVIDQRRMEFEVGYGLEGILTDIMCVRIQQTYMVPLAKEGKMSEAVLEGVLQVNKILTDPQYRDEVYADSLSSNSSNVWWKNAVSGTGLSIVAGIYALIAWGVFASRKNALKKAPGYVKNNYSEAYSKSKFSLLNIGLPAGYIAWQEIAGNLRIFEFALFGYGLLMLLLLEKRFRLNRFIFKDSAQKEPQETYNLLAKSHSNGWLAADIFFPLPFILYSLFNKGRMKTLRNTPPVSDKGVPMVKMDDKADDGFLNAFQIKEEELHSVDYDVWIDNPTHQVKIYRFENYNSKYKECPNCKTLAFLMTKNETLVSPTYDSSGKGQKTYTCKACSHVKKETYTIAKLTRSSSSGSGGSGGGGGGSSWGGGSSGGGGGGSSW